MKRKVKLNKVYPTSYEYAMMSGNTRTQLDMQAKPWQDFKEVAIILGLKTRTALINQIVTCFVEAADPKDIFLYMNNAKKKKNGTKSKAI